MAKERTGIVVGLNKGHVRDTSLFLLSPHPCSIVEAGVLCLGIAACDVDGRQERVGL